MILSDDINKCPSLRSPALKPGIELRISSDSRAFGHENCFLSLYGNNFDSVNFIEDVIKKGAEFILIEGRPCNDKIICHLETKYTKVQFVKVDNIFSFILELGLERSKRFQHGGGKVIAITGSNGKTTNKEMLRYLLGFLGEEKVHATQGNLNNHIGVPLTLFGLEEFHQVAIIEMGTSSPGEIENLVNWTWPQFGFITNIGYAHTEFLKDLDGVFTEKSSLYRGIENREGGLFIVNGFDQKLIRLKNKTNTVTLSEADLSLVQNDNLLGEHQKINMALCSLLAIKLYPQRESEIVERANNYKLPGMNRGEVKKFKDKTVYLDAYNANPDSMKASLLSFCEYLKKNGRLVEESIAILGDMNELGDNAKELHEEIGLKLRGLGFKDALFVGRYGESYARGFGRASKTFTGIADLKSWLREDKVSEKLWFIKGSRSLQLESILDING